MVKVGRLLRVFKLDAANEELILNPLAVSRQLRFLLICRIDS